MCNVCRPNIESIWAATELSLFVYKSTRFTFRDGYFSENRKASTRMSHLVKKYFESSSELHIGIERRFWRLIETTTFGGTFCFVDVT